MSKTKTVVLEYLRHYDRREHVYRVLQVTDNVDLTPGTILERDKVKELCEFPKWKVTIKQPNK